jgi:hypothetical protein
MGETRVEQIAADPTEFCAGKSPTRSPSLRHIPETMGLGGGGADHFSWPLFASGSLRNYRRSHR